MGKIGYPKDLISFTSEAILTGDGPKLMHPKVVGYFVVLLIMISALVVNISTRKSLYIEVIRDRTTLYWETKKGNIESVYTIVIRNKAQVKQNYTMKVKGLQTLDVFAGKNLSVKGSELMRYPISIMVDPNMLDKMISKLDIIVVSENGNQVSQEITFIYQ